MHMLLELFSGTRYILMESGKKREMKIKSRNLPFF